MKYSKTVTLKNGKNCCLRSGTGRDAQALCDIMVLTHGETDYLLSYPDEYDFTVESESAYLKDKSESENEVEILAVVDGCIVGTAGVDIIGKKFKLCHRAEFGVCVIKDFWGLGIGKALTEACIECARNAGYLQLELTVVSENSSAIELYRKLGFAEFGRNPKGFKSKYTGYQELVYMSLEL